MDSAKYSRFYRVWILKFFNSFNFSKLIIKFYRFELINFCSLAEKWYEIFIAYSLHRKISDNFLLAKIYLEVFSAVKINRDGFFRETLCKFDWLPENIVFRRPKRLFNQFVLLLHLCALRHSYQVQSILNCIRALYHDRTRM